MNPIALAGPAVEPVPLAAMKGYLRLDGTDEDELVAALIAAGRLTVEQAARLCLIEQTWRLRLDRWPTGRAVRLPIHPVIAMDAVRVAGPTGSMETVAPELYRLDLAADPARLLVDPVVPDPVRGSAGIEIDVLCGFGSSPAAVPEPLILAVRRLVAQWFEHRGDDVASTGPIGLPADVLALLAPFRRPRLA